MLALGTSETFSKKTTTFKILFKSYTFITAIVGIYKNNCQKNTLLYFLTLVGDFRFSLPGLAMLY